MDKLVDTTNHRLDDFRDDMDTHKTQLAQSLLASQTVIAAAVERKADKADLVVTVFRKNKAVQVVTGALALTMTPVIIDHWRMLVERFSSLSF